MMDLVFKLVISAILFVVGRWIPFAKRSTYSGLAALILGTIVCWLMRAQLPWSIWDGLAVPGVLLSWIFIEPAVHKFVLHANWRKWYNMPARSHLLHHQQPTPKNGLTPLCYVVDFCCLAWLVYPRPILSTIGCALLTLLVIYEICHYLIHLGVAPRLMREYHLHHHHYPQEKFGVTTHFF